MRKAVVLFFSVLLIVLFVFSFYRVFKRKVQEMDIKGFAEEKFGELFDARIKIGDIKIGLLKYISLSGLEIDQKLQEKSLYLVDVKKIIFRYNLFSFFKANISNPNKVYLYTPTIEFKKFNIPVDLFAKNVFGGGANIFFEVRDGNVSYDFPSIQTKFSLRDITGSILPLNTETFQVSFEARGGDDISGSLLVEGLCNSQDKTCSIDVALDDMAVRSGSFMPLQGLKGQANITNKKITIDDISFYMRDIPMRVQGTIDDFDTLPVLDLKFTLTTEHIVAGFTIFGSLDDLFIKGNLQIAQIYHYLYHGSIRLEESGFSLHDMTINDVYTARGDFSLSDGKYRFIVGKGNQAVTIDFRHENYSMTLDLALDHISFMNHDFVTVGRVKLEPALQFWTDNKLIMNGSIETDYMIFNYMPLSDFSGTFTLTPEAISKMDFSWGDVYSLTGQVKLDEPRSVDIALSVNDLDLREKNTLGGLELAKDLEATVHSRVLFNGPVSNPQIEGFIRSDKGRYRVFDFNRASVNFYGDRYVLDLKDSKLYRGDKVYYLEGKIDFTRNNIFHEVRVTSSEKIILWHGWDLSKDLREDTINVKRALSGDVALRLRGTYGSHRDDEREYEQGASLEYKYQNDKSLSFSFEDTDQSEGISLKHRIRF
jgi:hypothetical protein